MYRLTRRILAMALVLIAITTIAGCTSSAKKQSQYKEEAVVAMNTGDYAKAVSLFDEALSMSQARVSESEVDICYYKAVAQLNALDVDGAIDTYTALITYDEDNSYPLFLRGSVYLKCGEKTSALDDYRQAVEVDEDNCELYIAIYDNLSAYGFDKEGSEFLNIALERSGESRGDLITRGRIYSLLGQYDAAALAYEKAADKGSKEADIYLAEMYLLEGKVDKCDDIIDKYKEKRNLSSKLCNAIASVEIKRGNPKEAIDYINMGLEKFRVDNRRELLKNRVAAYEYMGSFDEAFTYATEYLANYPYDADMNRELEFLASRI